MYTCGAQSGEAGGKRVVGTQLLHYRTGLLLKWTSITVALLCYSITELLRLEGPPKVILSTSSSSRAS